MSKLLEKLLGDYRELSNEYDLVLGGAETENRDLSPSEASQLDGLRSLMSPLGDRLMQLREDEERKSAALKFMGDAGEYQTSTANVVQGSGAAIPGDGRRHPYPLTIGETQLRAVVDAIRSRTPYNESVELQTRAAVTTPVGAVVPVWWPPVPSGVEARIAEKIATRPAPDMANTFEYLAVGSPAVLGDVAEGTPKPDSGLVISRRSATLDKQAAYSDMSWEMEADFEGVGPLINVELASGLIRAENEKIVTAILADPGILAPVPAATSNVIKVLEAKQAVRSAPNVGQPDLIILNPNDWATLAGELASTSGLLIAGEQAITLGPSEMFWGMSVVQSVAVASKTVLLGVSDAAAFFLREGPRVWVDPYSQSTSNLTRIILEQRYAVGLTVPGRWAHFSLP